MQRRTRTRHHRKPYSTTRRVHRRRGFSKRYNRAKHTRYKKHRRRKTRRGRQRRGGGLFGVGARIASGDECQYVPQPAGEDSFNFWQQQSSDKKKFNCNVFGYQGVDDKWYMYRNPGAVGKDGKLRCSKKSATTKTPKVCPPLPAGNPVAVAPAEQQQQQLAAARRAKEPAAAAQQRRQQMVEGEGAAVGAAVGTAEGQLSHQQRRHQWYEEFDAKFGQ